MAWWEAALRLVLSVVIGCIIGVERERRHRPAGMRTHVLVCVGAAMIALLETQMMMDTLALNAQGGEGVAVSWGRISAQVVSGIGFLGAGTIFMNQKKISGLTTAASLWNTACLGLVIGMGYYALAAGGCLAVMLTLTLMQRLERPHLMKRLEIQFISRVGGMDSIARSLTEMGVRVIDVDVQLRKVKDKERTRHYTNLYTLDIPAKTDLGALFARLAAMEDVQSVRMVNNE